MDGFKDKFLSIVKQNTFEDYGKQAEYGRARKLSQLKIKILIWNEKDRIIKNIRNLFKVKKRNKEIKDRVIINIKTLFWKEENCWIWIWKYERKCNRN